jgi:DNA-binding MarR family transcriptional regulator
MNNLDKKLKELDHLKHCNYGRLLKILRGQFDIWVTEQLTVRHRFEFKLAHMPFIMNISVEGTNNNELARRARVTKQAMSKVSKELQDLGYIQVKEDQKDKRITVYTLTDRGKRFVIEARKCVVELMDEHRSVVGKTKYDAMLEVMAQLVEYQDKKLYGDA